MKAVVTALLVVLSAIACAGSSPLTVAEYVEWCQQEQLDDVTDGTWGQAEQGIENGISTSKSTVPPPELEGLHQANIKAMEMLLDIAKDKDDDRLVTIADLFTPELMALGFIIQSEQDALSSDLREQLESAGCLD